MAYSKEPVIKLTPADIETVRATCREVHGYKDYWVDEHGKNLYFILSRPISSMGKQIFSRKVPISRSNGYLGATLVLYESMGFYIEFPGPTEDTLLCSREVKRMHMAVIVALAWIGPKPDPSLDARHLDGNKNHNHHSNIAWGSRKENGLDTKWHNKVGRGKPESVRPECRKTTP